MSALVILEYLSSVALGLILLLLIKRLKLGYMYSDSYNAQMTKTSRRIGFKIHSPTIITFDFPDNAHGKWLEIFH